MILRLSSFQPIMVTLCLFAACKQTSVIAFNQVSKTKKTVYHQEYGANSNDQVTPTKVASFENKTFYYFLDFGKQKIFSYDMVSNELINEINISSIASLITLNRTTQFQWVEKDKLGIFSNDDQKIILIDTTGKIISKANTREAIGEASYVAVSYFDRTFTYHQNKVYINKAYTDFILDSKKNYKKYYSRSMSLMIDFSTNKKEHLLKAPSLYQKGNHYGDYDIYSCVGSNNQIIFSFPSNDSLYIYKDNLMVEQVFAGSEEKHSFAPYNISKNKNLATKREYNVTRPFYQKVIYSPYQDVYYRVYKKQSSYLDDEGKIRRDYSWSLVVLDNGFNIIGELSFNSKNASPATIVPVKEGLIISDKINGGVVESYSLYTIDIAEK